MADRSRAKPQPQGSQADFAIVKRSTKQLRLTFHHVSFARWKMKISRDLSVVAGLSVIAVFVIGANHFDRATRLGQEKPRHSTVRFDDDQVMQQDTSAPGTQKIISLPCNEERPRLLTSVYREQRATS
ncbi:hypothetical protein [Paraburkholderia sp. SIMBA_030]|uniref:hypothetical protein n=1 Tax=Paraburkholderia sp. SIMBA_030 TaxID=3085773 RepID=UPI00397B432F